MKRLGIRPQRTLADSVSVSGVGFITGCPVKLKFLPAPVDHGVVFQRIDHRQMKPIPARVESVTGTERRTTLGSGNNQVTLVEHVLSALAGLRIDNCIIELDSPEPPGLDGSAWEFVRAIQSVGTVTQSANREVWSPTGPIRVSQNGATLTLHPGTTTELKMSYLLHYGPHSPIPTQCHTLAVNPGTYTDELATSRTFVLESEAYLLQTQGIGLHLTPKEIVVFGERGPIENPLRFADEPARHKILDLVGDLSLAGIDLAGHVVAYRSGHPLNVELAQVISQSLRGEIRSPSVRLAA